ncbi:MAG: DUF1850 domain-containing protein [Hoeflea sp.]|uniref:DUF1850 domain-containing protein n=1 Tax=Hoeflea sp. TaxID=1940281 RepID=UPI001DF69250|nr:DUF1850 domain-containing protein [Hoeflea sp.]MBU4528840.1 DUF1850 domain-containing protein [Alphaproteobacteria bacterium]MBU4545833.1 DUF1850 domain-containing protein [Alphaproteobacteria bacterium]MBU4549974.1 DUF1850 domain-containing protein [Alphaproteobacteria bacterium]MBV1725971.1 DUF1850 domain-containing protein [Hoeflea sp.]MBV1762696.1 DUF1850 domain-containing protein [Hoeflea sp.]
MVLGLCVAAGGKTLMIAATMFTLSWTHSVEKTAWEESWLVTGQGLQLTEARIKGSGAGMDPGEGARLEDGWWVWSPDAPPVPELLLASSGATVSAWELCHAGGCLELGSAAQAPVRIGTCAP